MCGVRGARASCVDMRIKAGFPSSLFFWIASASIVNLSAIFDLS